MIMQLKNGTVFATGKVTSRGAETRQVGSTDKMTWGMAVDNYKDELGNWQKVFLNCALWGDDIDAAPDIQPGDRLFVTGRTERRKWTGRDGEERTSEETRVDFVALATSVAPYLPAAPKPFTPAQKPVDVQSSVFDEYNEDDDDLPF